MPASTIIKHRVVAVCVNRTYKPGMNAADRYECTRGIWKLNPNRAENAELVFAVYHGDIVAVFEFTQWDPAGTTSYRWRKFTKKDLEGRQEFVGSEVPSKYVGQQLPDRMFRPFLYYNC
jgi:hypothetical protein